MDRARAYDDSDRERANGRKRAYDREMAYDDSARLYRQMSPIRKDEHPHVYRPETPLSDAVTPGRMNSYNSDDEWRYTPEQHSPRVQDFTPLQQRFTTSPQVVRYRYYDYDRRERRRSPERTKFHTPRFSTSPPPHPPISPPSLSPENEHVTSIRQSQPQRKWIHQPETRHGSSTNQSSVWERSLSPMHLADSSGDDIAMHFCGLDIAERPGSRKFREQFLHYHSRKNASRFISVSVEMPNIFIPFLREEIETNDSLWDLVVLVGSPGHSYIGEHDTETLWATSCGEYISYVWPESAEAIRKWIHSIQGHNGFAQLSGTEHEASTSYEGLKSRLLHDLSLDLNGPALHVIDMLEAISWLFAVLQTESTDGPDGCSIRCRYDGKAYALSVNNLSTLSAPYHSSCWMPLFPKTPCAVDFPSRIRPAGMIGLELRFELLCLLCGLEYVVQDEEGVLLFGAESLVYPVQREANCVQWHLQHCEPHNEKQHQIRGKRLRTLDLESLCAPENRHFLGMWPQASITLGTDAQVYDQIEYSNAEILDHENEADSFSFGAAVSIKGIFSLNGSRNYKIAKSRKPVTMSSLDARLYISRNEPVMLYSPSEKRAWMVPYMSVFWHLLRAQADAMKRLGYNIPPCSESGNGGDAAWECFMACRTDPARKPAKNQKLMEIEKAETVQDFAEDLWRTMDFAMRRSCLRKRLVRDKIVGFELADIATGAYQNIRECGLDFTISGSWAPLLNHVRLTFFYEGLTDPILPAEQMRFDGVCGSTIWRTTPKDFNLLTASLPCLAFLARDQNAGRKTLTRLGPGRYWSSRRPAGQLFYLCDRNYQHICSRLQEIRRENQANDPKILKSEAEKDGAVVFRYRYGMRDIAAREEKALVVRRANSEYSISDTPSSSGAGYKARTRSSTDRKHKDSSDSGYSSGNRPPSNPAYEHQRARSSSSSREPESRNGSRRHKKRRRRSRRESTKDEDRDRRSPFRFLGWRN